MSRRVLDLFCGAGGAAVGYARAGFRAVGIDVEPQPNYPFPFVRADALEPPVELEGFDLIHASPPCQAYTCLSNRWRGSGGLADERVPMLEATRDLLRSAGVPYVLENVPGAAKDMVSPTKLTGEMFGLGVHRPRYFECSPWLMGPSPERAQKDPVAVYGKMDGRLLWERQDGTELRAPSDLETPSRAMGIDWMDWSELTESIPPAYTEYIGRRMLEVLT